MQFIHNFASQKCLLVIRLVQYNETEFQDKANLTFDQALQKIRKKLCNWWMMPINQPELLNAVSSEFGIHHLITEDIQDIRHLPKTEFSDSYIYLTCKVFRINNSRDIEPEHFNIIFTQNNIITFHEDTSNPLFEAIVKRISNSLSRHRKSGTDYLFYSILDSIVDHYLSIVEMLRDEIEEIEDAILNNVTTSYKEIMLLRGELQQFRRYSDPVREAISKIRTEKHFLVSTSLLTYFRDIYDHLIHIQYNLDSTRDLLNNLIELHHTKMGAENNQVMKTLTIISTLFIPLTFIVGVYGMNFKYMPEIEWPYSYPVLVVLMLILASFMLVYMRKKKWF